MKLIPASHGLVSPILLNTLWRVSMNPEDVIFNPRIPFNWDATMMTEVADVKPTVTGIDMKSIKTSVSICK